MSSQHKPTEIKLHQKSHLLEIHFDNGKQFKYSCEYLRTHARSAEIETSELPVYGKADVNIEKIEPQGNYALRLYFDDGYDSGIFSWDTLYELGEQQQTLWNEYLAQLDQHGLARQAANSAEQDEITIRLMFFMNNMLQVTRKESEDINLPQSINTVEGLLKFLRSRGENWQRMFADNTVQVTVNKQFAELFTRLENGDEVAFVPVSKDI